MKRCIVMLGILASNIAIDAKLQNFLEELGTQDVQLKLVESVKPDENRVRWDKQVYDDAICVLARKYASEIKDTIYNTCRPAINRLNTFSSEEAASLIAGTLTLISYVNYCLKLPAEAFDLRDGIVKNTKFQDYQANLNSFSAEKDVFVKMIQQRLQIKSADDLRWIADNLENKK